MRSAVQGGLSHGEAQRVVLPERLGTTTIVIGLVAILSACDIAQPIAGPDCRNETVYVSVGDVDFVLRPGPTYSLGSLSDEAINSAIATGQGTPVSPLDVPNLWAGVPSVDGSRLEFDVTIVGSTGHPAARDAVGLPNALSDLASVSFDLDMSDRSDETIKNNIILKFRDGKSSNVPVTCRAQHLEGARSVLTCSDLLLIYAGNFVSINSRSGDFDAVLRDFRNGLVLISKMERR